MNLEIAPIPGKIRLSVVRWFVMCWDVIHFCVYFGSIVGESIPFSILGSLTFSSFRIKSGNDPSL
jgi:hypothetical protein